MPSLPRADVAIISGSTSDAHIVGKVTKVLDEHQVSYEHHVISAHRNPDELDAFLKKSDAQ
ncbi:MAG TPA: AIR carboxylase family protein, partial [Methanomicrobiales archaeon]|nr:AIR carboxylase family protein [Methanomicrobiales archaeon]